MRGGEGLIPLEEAHHFLRIVDHNFPVLGREGEGEEKGGEGSHEDRPNQVQFTRRAEEDANALVPAWLHILLTRTGESTEPTPTFSVAVTLRLLLLDPTAPCIVPIVGGEMGKGDGVEGGRILSRGCPWRRMLLDLKMIHVDVLTQTHLKSCNPFTQITPTIPLLDGRPQTEIQFNRK